MGIVQGIFTDINTNVSPSGASQVTLVLKNLPANAGDVRDAGLIPGWEVPLEKEMAAQSSLLAWKIPWTEECGRLQSTGSQRVGHDGVTFTHIVQKIIVKN